LPQIFYHIMKHLITFSFCLLALFSYSQKITRFVWLDNEEIKDLTKRKLVLCAYTESDAEIERLTKKMEKAKEDKKKELQNRIEYHKSLAKIFKDDMLALVKENWSLNSTENLEIMTFNQLKSMRGNALGKEKVVLMLRYFEKSGAEYDPTKASVDLPAMTYQGCEHFGSNNHLVSFPLLYSNEDDHCRKDAQLTIKLLERLVKANLSSTKRVDVNDFVEAEIAKNCKQKSSTETIINKNLLKNVEIAEVKEAYGSKIKPLDNDEFVTAYQGSTPNLAAVCLPSTIAEGSIGPISSSALIFGRLIINTSTSEICGYSDFIMGEKAGELMFKKGHFKNMGGCK
jgi:hypothetical protein